MISETIGATQHRPKLGVIVQQRMDFGHVRGALA